MLTGRYVTGLRAVGANGAPVRASGENAGTEEEEDSEPFDNEDCDDTTHQHTPG